MLRKALFNIIRQEQRQVEGQIEVEESSPSPDVRRVSSLRREADTLRQELEHFPEARA